MPLRRQRYDPNTKHSRSLIREHDFGYRGAGPKGFRGIDPYGNSPSSEALRQRALRDPATQAMRGEIGKTSGLSSQRGMIGLPSPTGGVMAERIRTPRARNTRDEYRIQQQVAALSREAFDKQRLDSRRAHELALGEQRFVTPTRIGEAGATERTRMTLTNAKEVAAENRTLTREIAAKEIAVKTEMNRIKALGTRTPQQEFSMRQMEQFTASAAQMNIAASKLKDPKDGLALRQGANSLFEAIRSEEHTSELQSLS